MIRLGVGHQFYYHNAVKRLELGVIRSMHHLEST